MSQTPTPSDSTPVTPTQPPERPLVPALAVLETPHFHLLGYSVAGEESFVQVPEYNVNFDIGKCPRPALLADFCLLTHGHIDHTAGLIYYLAQRQFLDMKPATVACPRELEPLLRNILKAWSALEEKVSQHVLVPMDPGDELQVHKTLFIKAFYTRHRVPSLGYVMIDRREKLRADLLALNLPGHKLKEMKDRGEKITNRLDVPMVAYTGDTNGQDTLLQEHVRDAKVLITECTFFEAEHRRRAAHGYHFHADEIIEILPQLRNELVVLTHVTRRTYLRKARRMFAAAMEKFPDAPKVEFLMDHAQKLVVKPGRSAPYFPPKELPDNDD